MQVSADDGAANIARSQRKKIIQIAAIVVAALAIASSVLYVVLPSSRTAMAYPAEDGMTIGPLDELGCRVINMQALPGHAVSAPRVYTAEALSIKRAAIKKVAAAEKAAVEEAPAEQAPVAEDTPPVSEEPAVQSEPIVEEQWTPPTPEELAAAQAAEEEAARKWEEEQERAREQARQEAIAEAQRIADEKRAMEQVMKQRAEEAAAAEALRRQIQQQQAAEAARRAQEEARYQWSLTHPSDGQYKSMIAIAGELIPYVISTDICPDDTAGAWRWGSGRDMANTRPLVDDNKGTYFVGHNPGVFHGLIDSNVKKGDIISVWDEKGHGKAYTVDDIFVIEAGALFDGALQKRTILSGGECIALQTCIDGGDRYKVFVAHAK